MKRNKILALQILIFSLGAILLAIGLTHGELIEIMRKAVIVCLECIGIG